MFLKLLATTGLAASLSAGAVAVQLPAQDDGDRHGRHGRRPPAHANGHGYGHDHKAKAKVKAKEVKRSARIEVGEEEKVDADGGGDATVVRTDAGLELGPVDPAEGFTSTVKKSSGSLIEITFKSADQLIHLVMELDGATVQVKIITQPVIVIDDDGDADEEPAAEEEPSTTTTTEPPADEPETTDHSAGDAGTVQLTSDDTRLVVTDVRLNAGWTYKMVRRSGPEAEVVFVKETFRLHFMARLVDSRIQTEVVPDEAESDEAPAPSDPAQGDEAPAGENPDGYEETGSDEQPGDDTDAGTNDEEAPDSGSGEDADGGDGDTAGQG